MAPSRMRIIVIVTVMVVASTGSMMAGGGSAMGSPRVPYSAGAMIMAGDHLESVVMAGCL